MGSYRFREIRDWVPDIGLTSYFNKSIFRPHPINEKSDSKILSHRFWERLKTKVIIVEKSMLEYYFIYTMVRIAHLNWLLGPNQLVPIIH